MPRFTVYLGSLTLLLGVSLVVRCKAAGSDAVTTRRGDSIVVAVEQFATTEHRYPDSLPELVPRYLKSLPSAGPRYRYWRLWRPIPGDQRYRALEERVRSSGLPVDSVMPKWELTACIDAATTCSRALYRSSLNPIWIYEP